MASKFFFSDCEVARAMARFDWAGTRAGAPSTWPPLLLAQVNMMLDSPESQYLVWDPDQLSFFSNAAYLPILGARASQSIGRTLPELWADAYAAVRPPLEAAFEGRASRFEDQFVEMARQGRPERTWWTYSFAPVRDARGVVRAVLCHTTETTRRVVHDLARMRESHRLSTHNDQLQHAVNERTQERDRIWEVSQDMLLVADADGRWLHVNPAWTLALGWAGEDLLGRTSEWLEHPDDREKTRAEVARLAQGVTTVAFENRLRTRDGDYRTLSWKATPHEGRLYCVARDVTLELRNSAELVRRRRELEESEARVRAVFDTSPEYLMLIRVDTDGIARFADVNANVEHLTQHRRADMIGRPLRELLPASSADDAEHCAFECLRTGEPQRYSARRQYPDRPAVLVSAVVAPVERAADGTGTALLIARDVTEASEMSAQLRQAQKMEAVGQLTGGIAHDFNNLLSTIGTSLDLVRMRARSATPEEIERYVGKAARSVKSAAALSQRLLSFSRKQQTEVRSVDVNELVRGLEELLRRSLGARVELAVDAALDAWHAAVDISQLESALLNLVINARDALPQGGAIAISTSNVELGAGESGTLRAGGYVRVTVRDNGTGMSEEVRARAFEPFFTTKPAGQGTGLGLAMIHNFARQAGGGVSIDSSPGKGTAVHIWLPRETAALDEAAGAAAQASPPQGSGQRILVVESAEDLRELLAEGLAACGYRTELEADPGAAVARLLAAPPYDLMVTAVELAGMSGRQLAARAKAIRPEMPVLLISGSGGDGAPPAVGEVAILAKPFTMDELSARIGTLL